MSVTIQSDPGGQSLESGTPTPLFRIGRYDDYAVSDDGKSVLVDIAVGQAKTSPVTIILNWKPKP